MHTPCCHVPLVALPWTNGIYQCMGCDRKYAATDKLYVFIYVGH